MRAIALDPQVMDSNFYMLGERVIVAANYVAVHDSLKSLYLDKLFEDPLLG